MKKSKFLKEMLKRMEVNSFAVLLMMLLPLSVFASCDSANNESANSNEQETELVNDNLVLVCADTQVMIVKSTTKYNSIPEIVWSWTSTSPTKVPSNYNAAKFATIAECKAVNGGKQIAIASSSGAAGIIEKEDKSMSFYVEVPNAHSIDILPGNLVVVAASVTSDASLGNKIMLFDQETAELLQSFELYSAHGVVWDTTRNSLFALGDTVLREYKLNNRKLSLNYEWTLPGTGGHDLSLAPDNAKLYLTEHNGAWQFNLTTKAFTKIAGFPDARNIKSLSQNANGRFLYTIPEESWWTYHVSFFNSGGSLAFPSKRVYKARWYN